MKKIYINKNDSAPLAVEKIIGAPTDKVTLYIPRFSKLTESNSNFHLIKREAEAAGKSVTIESVDDAIVTAASKAGLPAVNPFFQKSHGAISDIVAPDSTESKGEQKSKEDQEDSASTELGDIEKHIKPDKKSISRTARLALTVVVLILILTGTILIGIKVLPKAEINLTLSKTNWEYAGPVVVDQSLEKKGGFVAEDGTIHLLGEIFTKTKNISQSFPASGREAVERKARGAITIYNNFDTNPQTLVNRTRFETPDGKVFRITKKVTVPAAKKVDGKLIPQSAEAEVTADEAGVEYNIGPVDKFTIPGFAGTPRFNGFYAVSTTPMTGGYIGETNIATEEDIKKAKAETVAALEEVVRTEFLATLPEGVKTIEGATEFTVTKEEVQESLGEDSETFTIFAEGELKVFIFKESDLFSNFAQIVSVEKEKELELKDYTLDYREGVADFKDKKLSFIANFQSVWAEPVNPEELVSQSVGKNESELRALLASVSGVESASVSLWPFWVKKAPGKSQKINITVD